MSLRDEFPEQNKTALALRCGHRCCNPQCRRPTVGPKSSPNQVVNLGVAAHITAAAPGGPRYDPSISSVDRKDISNGIWLCQTCAKLIDSDEKRFPVELLRSWKTAAEQSAHLALEAQCTTKDTADIFMRLMAKMPAIFEEMAEDMRNTETQLIREFVCLPHEGVVFNHDRPRFQYFESTHANLMNAVALLEDHGFVTHYTLRRTPIYRMTEEFVDLLLAIKPEAE